jgi:hypothetical protein
VPPDSKLIKLSAAGTGCRDPAATELAVLELAVLELAVMELAVMELAVMESVR